VYTPSADEIASAEGIVATAAEAAARGEAAALSADGRFVDPAVVARARTVLDRAGPAAQRVSPAPQLRSGEDT
jgi:citrate lyase subunit beta/citryl-CoA lyase